jgi:regulatory protein
MARARNHSPKPLTRARLDALALRYVGRYAATRAMLERTLMNHLRRARMARQDIAENEAKKWIREIADTHVRKGFVNDGAYAEMIKTQGRRSGWSANKISQKLMVKGIKSDAIKTVLGEAAHDEDDMQAALIFARRKHLGAWRKKPDADRNKEMEKICRAGFSPDIARKLVRLDIDQCTVLLEELRTRYA